jgi:hypothetical protein
MSQSLLQASMQSSTAFVILPSDHSPVRVSCVISLRAGMYATIRLPSCHASSSEVGSMIMFFPKQDTDTDVTRSYIMIPASANARLAQEIMMGRSPEIKEIMMGRMEDHLNFQYERK